jgi:hypothetical protein
MSFAAEGAGMDPRLREDDAVCQVIQITTNVEKAANSSLACDLQ